MPDLIRELFGAGAEAVLQAPPEWVQELHEAVLTGERIAPVAADPLLAVRRVLPSAADVAHQRKSSDGPADG